MQTDYNLIVGIVSIVIGAALGAFFTWWSIYQSRRIAVESGAFKKAVPSIYFLNKDLSKIPLESTTWVLLCPKDADSSTYYLSFQVANEGDAPLDFPVFTVQGSNNCIINAPEAGCLKCVPGVMKDSIKRSIVDLGNFNQLSYMLSHVGSRTSTELTDPFCFNNTVGIPVTNKSILKDGVKLKYTFKYTYSYRLSLGLLTKDYPSVKCDLNIMCMPADSIAEAKDLLSKELTEGRATGKKYYAFLHFEIDKKEKHNNKYIYLMKTYSEAGFKMEVFHI